MGELGVIYHWWSESPMKVWEDWQNPVIMAIATLRAYSREAEVHVLDCSSHANDWGQFPSALRFQVTRVPREVPFATYDPVALGCDYPLCSRAFSVPRFADGLDVRTAFFSDSDIFWLKDPCPLERDPARFCVLRKNNGVFYYNPRAPAARYFIGVWQLAIRQMLGDMALAREMVKNYGFSLNYRDPGRCPRLNDEVAYVWIVDKWENHRRCIDFLSHRENYIKNGGRRKFGHPARFDPDAKNVHLVNFYTGRGRGMYGIMVREFYEAMERSLPGDLLDLLRQGSSPRISIADFNVQDIRSIPRRSRLML